MERSLPQKMLKLKNCPKSWGKCACVRVCSTCAIYLYFVRRATEYEMQRTLGRLRDEAREADNEIAALKEEVRTLSLSLSSQID